MRPPALVARRLAGVSTVYRNVAGTVAASMVVQVCLLVNGVATARMLGVLDRGHWALLLLLSTVLPVIATCGVPLALTYWIARDPAIGRRLLLSLRRTVAWQIVALLAMNIVVLYVVYHDAPAYVQRSAVLSLALSLAIAFWALGMAVLQGNQQFRALNLSRMVSPAINAVLMVGFLAAGFHSLFLVTLTGVVLYWLTAVITGIAAIRGLPADAIEPVDDSRIPSVRTMMSFSLKALLGSITPLQGLQIDQAIVGIFISRHALGLYVVAVAFTNAPRFLAQGIGLVAYPHFAAMRDAADRARDVIRFVGMTLLLCGSAILVIEFAIPFLVPFLFGRAFEGATGVARILLVSTLLFGVRRVLSECARGAGRPALGSIAEAVSLVALFPALGLFFHSGAKGVALALVFAAAAGLVGIVVGWLARPAAGRVAETVAPESSEALVES
jgi:O-antigen/teichoic acid export membrane protein